MGDDEIYAQSSKKRAAEVQITQLNPGLDDDEETSKQEAGTFKRASNEVLATRKIVKVRRQQASSTPSAPEPAPSTNPFAAIRLVTPVEVVKSKDDEQNDNKNETQSEKEVFDNKNETQSAKEVVDNKNETQSAKEVVDNKNETQSAKEVVDNKNETQSEKEVVEEPKGESHEEQDKNDVNYAKVDESKTESNVEDEHKVEAEESVGEKIEKTVEKTADSAPFSSFQQLSSNQNAFSGISGTGFSTSVFSFGSISKDGSPSGSTTGSLFGLKNDQPSFNFGQNSSVFGTLEPNTILKSEGSKIPTMPEVPVETGEEDEKAVFAADSVLFEFVDGSWKERGKGELKVNVSTTGNGKSRLVMRVKGNYRLILNAALFPDMKLTNMDKKGITFACVNTAVEGKEGLSTIALKFRDGSIVEEFKAAVIKHKPTAPVATKSPENSPKLSDE